MGLWDKSLRTNYLTPLALSRNFKKLSHNLPCVTLSLLITQLYLKKKKNYFIESSRDDPDMP